MNAREMNKKANAYLEFVAVDYFNNTMLPKIEERADWGHFFATFYAKYDSDVARAKDYLIGYCENLGFEVQYELTTNHKCFTVSWEHTTEDDVEYDKPIIFVDEELPVIEADPDDFVADDKTETHLYKVSVSTLTTSSNWITHEVYVEALDADAAYNVVEDDLIAYDMVDFVISKPERCDIFYHAK